MKVLHTIHTVGEYSNESLYQAVHESQLDNIKAVYYEINHMEPEDVNDDLGSDTIINEHGIFTSHSSLAESYVILG